jgi:hypothetical protein
VPRHAPFPLAIKVPMPDRRGRCVASGMLAGLLANACAHAPPETPRARLCARTDDRTPRTARADAASYEMDSPTCSMLGPSVDATPVSFFFGGRKPPVGYQQYDFRIRNPTGISLWLVLERDGEFPSMTSVVTLERSRTARPSIYRWSIEGYTRSYDEKGTGSVESASWLRALYVDAHADVTLRGVLIETTGPPVTISVQFVDEIAIEGQSATDWLGSDARLPARGDIPVDSGWEGVIRRELERPACVWTHVHILCVQPIPTSR